MSENIKWTIKQQRAIDVRGRNVLVAAGAGSGKTAVLVERVIKMITDNNNGIDIDKLLIATFTNAAAAEMRAKIAEAISKELDLHPDNATLQKQLTLLPKASITTIHSFCLDIIRNNFHILDIPPDFRIADETEALLLKNEAIEEIFEEMYEDENFTIEFGNLVEFYGGGKNDNDLIKIIFDIFGFVQSLPFPEEWLFDAQERFNLQDSVDVCGTVWGFHILEYLSATVQDLLIEMKEALEQIEMDSGLANYFSTYKNEVDYLNIVKNTLDKDWDTIANAFNGMQFETLKRCSKDSKESADRVKAIRDNVKKTIKKIREDFFAQSNDEYLEDISSIYPEIKCLCELVLKLIERFSLKKKEKALVDFNDLEHFAIKILTERVDGKTMPTKSAVQIRDKYAEILIDEYQDSNKVQDLIFQTISRKDSNVFMVGDVKQSIYRFRNAEPELFIGKYKTYKVSGEGSQKIQLFENFRSRQEIIGTVNFIFGQIMSEHVGDIEYGEDEELQFGAEYYPEPRSDNATEIHIIDLRQDDELNEYDAFEMSEDVDVPQSAIEVEASYVAQRIIDLIHKEKFMVYDKETSGYKAVTYRDIVILMRSTINRSDIYSKALFDAGIPVYADTGTGYFASTEIMTMMSLLKVIDNPLQDIPLTAVLRSPMFSFSEDELIEIRLSLKRGYFYNAVVEAAKIGNDKCKEFIDSLMNWREKSKYTPTDELIWQLFSDTSYYMFVGAMRGGEGRQANLRVLFEKARQFEQTSFKGLFNFIEYLNNIIIGQKDYGSAKMLGENEDVVRIMSIHKSKGLEFPVVFLCDCAKQFNNTDAKQRILKHTSLGIAPDFVDLEKRITYPTLPKLAVKNKIKAENISEEMRILYVALTRAKEKLIITGTAKDLEKSSKRWSFKINSDSKKLSRVATSNANCFMDWIAIAAIRMSSAVEMRTLAGAQDISILVSGCDIKLHVITKRETTYLKQDLMNDDKDIPQVTLLNSDIQNDIRTEIDRRLSYKYPYLEGKKIPTKLSVTELKNIYRDTDESDIKYSYVAEKPKFLSDWKGISAAQKGTILHIVMQHLDYTHTDSIEEIKEQIIEMTNKHFISTEQSETVSKKLIYEFFNGEIGRRLKKSDKVYREQRFFLEIDAKEIYNEYKNTVYENEKIILQGIIDCFFIENNNIILLDYKTDIIIKEDISQIFERYKTQMDYYEKAIYGITGESVSEKYIYLFNIGKAIKF